MEFNDAGTERSRFFLCKEGGVVQWKITYKHNNGTVLNFMNATPSPAINTWYCLEFNWRRNNTIQAWINGSLIGTSSYNAGDVQVNQACVGICWSNGAIGNVWFDDVFVDSSYIGPTAAISYNLTLQARDKDGTNLPRAVNFKGTYPNGTSFDVTSDSSGRYVLSTPAGTVTVNTWWSNHLVDSSRSVSVSASQTENIDTKMARLDSGTAYLLVSVNETSLPSPSKVGSNDWQMLGVSGSGSKQLKVDVANWVATGEPEILKINGNPYEYGWTWSSANKILTWLLDLSGTAINFEMSWTSLQTDSGQTFIPATPINGQESDNETLIVPVAPYVPEEEAGLEISSDTVAVVVGGAFLVVIVAVVYSWLHSRKSLSSMWDRRESKKTKPRW